MNNWKLIGSIVQTSWQLHGKWFVINFVLFYKVEKYENILSNWLKPIESDNI